MGCNYLLVYLDFNVSLGGNLSSWCTGLPETYQVKWCQTSPRASLISLLSYGDYDRTPKVMIKIKESKSWYFYKSRKSVIAFVTWSRADRYKRNDSASFVISDKCSWHNVSTWQHHLTQLLIKYLDIQVLLVILEGQDGFIDNYWCTSSTLPTTCCWSSCCWGCGGWDSTVW